MIVQCHAETVSPEDYLTVGEVLAFVAGLPSGATLEPIMSERGHQRDPIECFVGLKATWSETRQVA